LLGEEAADLSIYIAQADLRIFQNNPYALGGNGFIKHIY
jgi:hypothetical protein